MKVLTIISEVFIKEDGTETVSRSLNIILDEYSKYFERINVVGPGLKDFEFTQGKNPKLSFTSTTLYSKRLKKRVNYYLNTFKVKKYFNRIIIESKADIVQIRIPSLFSMMAYSEVKKIGLPLTSYIAGEWRSSFIANYGFIGNSILAKMLDNSQKKIIQNSIAVSAGPEIGEMYKKLNEIYSYFSTTHLNIHRVEKNNDILELLFVGRLEGLKRIEDGISALKMILDDGIKAKFHIVGDGVQNKIIAKKIDHEMLNSKVILYGYISDTIYLEKLYKKADVFVFPSISEGTPKVLAEAMSYGVIPIAVRDTGSIKHIIKDGENGFLVDAYSPKQIYDKIKLIANSKITQNNMQQKCYEYAEKHTISKEVENMWSFIFKNIKNL